MMRESHLPGTVQAPFSFAVGDAF